MDAAAVAQLVWRAKRGDREAFAALIRQTERTALAVAYAATGSDADRAGDVTQEAFLRAWQRLSSLADDGKFATWLCGIVRNLAVDAHRKSRSLRPVVREDERVCDPSSEIEARETAQRVADAIAALDEVSQTVIALRYYNGLASADIAELLGTTPAAIDMRLTRARHALKMLLDAECPTSGE